MAPNPRRVDAKLQALYERVPRMLDCKGLCADSCGPIECSVREREKIERESSRELQACPIDCSMLTPMGRCSVYESRPMICRLWGTSRKMACEHGCTPERWLSDDEFFDLIAESFIVGGPPPGLEVDVLRRHVHSVGVGAQLADLAVALRVARASQRPLSSALGSIEGSTPDPMLPAVEDDTPGRSRRSGR